MLLEEFEQSPAVIEPTDKAIRGGGEVCETFQWGNRRLGPSAA